MNNVYMIENTPLHLIVLMGEDFSLQAQIFTNKMIKLNNKFKNKNLLH